MVEQTKQSYQWSLESKALSVLQADRISGLSIFSFFTQKLVEVSICMSLGG